LRGRGVEVSKTLFYQEILMELPDKKGTFFLHIKNAGNTESVFPTFSKDLHNNAETFGGSFQSH